MIHPSDIDRSSVTVNRASGERNPFPPFVGPRFELIEVVAHVVLALAFCVACVWFYETFLAAVPAISRIVGGR